MSKAEELANKTGAVCEKLRRTPMPISDVVPHMQALADELRRLAQVEAEHAALLKAIMDAEPVAWVNKGQIKSAEISRERGGPYDSHMWNECPTAFFQEPLYTLNGIKP